MLLNLARIMNEAALIASRPTRPDVCCALSALVQFRAKVAEFQALASVVDGNLQGRQDARSEELRAQRRRLEALMLDLIVRSCRRFFQNLADAEVLPLGVHELCQAELRLLSITRGKIANPDLRDMLSPALNDEIEAMDQCLHGIMVRSPALIQFEAA